MKNENGQLTSSLMVFSLVLMMSTAAWAGPPPSPALVPASFEARGNVAEPLWAVRYNGPGGADDEAMGISLSPGGRILVAGSSFATNSGLDYTTISYNEDGEIVWIARSDGGHLKDDQAIGVQIDENENIYVVGSSVDARGLMDFYAVKYSADGIELWSASYDGPAGEDDQANDFAIDASGNLLVLGSSRGADGNLDIICVKYDSDGAESATWVYSGDAGLDDRATALLIGDSDRIVACGDTETAPGIRRMATFELDDAGVILWAAQYSGLAGDDRASDLAFDENGDVIVAGISQGLDDEFDIVAAAYDNNGQRQWTFRHDPESASCDGISITVGEQGSSYISANAIFDSETSSGVVVKIDSDGNEVWLNSYSGLWGGSNLLTDIALWNGISILTGSTQSGLGERDVLILAYDENGDELGAMNYDSGQNQDDHSVAAAISDDNYLYLAATSKDSAGMRDFLTLKFDIECAGCRIEGECRASGATHPENDCLACIPSVDPGGWSANDGAPCDDEQFCNGDDFCAGGECSSHEGDVCLDDELYCNGGEFCDEANDRCEHIGDPCHTPWECSELLDECIEGSDAPSDIHPWTDGDSELQDYPSGCAGCGPDCYPNYPKGPNNADSGFSCSGDDDDDNDDVVDDDDSDIDNDDDDNDDDIDDDDEDDDDADDDDDDDDDDDESGCGGCSGCSGGDDDDDDNDAEGGCCG
jgi:hypothetical protein